MEKLLKSLKERDLIYQFSTDENTLSGMLDGEKKLTFYLGIDPTATSIHIGTLVSLLTFRRLQDAGHKGVLLLGGATGMIGDPSGKDDIRKIMTSDTTENNVNQIKNIVSRFIKLDGDNPAIIVNNKDWIGKFSYIDFLREVGVHFNVNTMLSAEAYSRRIANGGLTFLELGYMLVQGYDFVHLNKAYGCTLQIGGSDQWGNIVAGVELNRKMAHLREEEKDIVVGLTFPLLMTKDGKKMGKTEKGTVWLTEDKTSAFDLYQYLYNVDDQDVETLLKKLTFLPIEKIEELLNGDIIVAKKCMAYEITKLVHGKDKADQVLDAVSSLFGNKVSLDNVPQVTLSRDLIVQGINAIELFVQSQFIVSKGEARRMIDQGGLMVNDDKIVSYDMKIDSSFLKDDYVLLKKGKKNFLKVIFK